MPEAGLKIAQKGLKKHVFCQNFAEAPSLARVWVGYLGFCGGSNPPPPRPPARACVIPLFTWSFKFGFILKLIFRHWYIWKLIKTKLFWYKRPSETIDNKKLNVIRIQDKTCSWWFHLNISFLTILISLIKCDFWVKIIQSNSQHS